VIVHGHEKSQSRHDFDPLNVITFLVYDMAAVMIATAQCLGLCWQDTIVGWIMN
jgi:hypothetical protein